MFLVFVSAVFLHSLVGFGVCLTLFFFGCFFLGLRSCQKKIVNLDSHCLKKRTKNNESSGFVVEAR